MRLPIRLTLSRPANHLAQVIPHPGLIDVDHLPHRLVFSIVHCRSSQSERNKPKNHMCERIGTLSMKARFGGLQRSANEKIRREASNIRIAI
jgi:hypothetical protein